MISTIYSCSRPLGQDDRTGPMNAKSLEGNGETRIPKSLRCNGVFLIVGVPGCVEDLDRVVDERQCGLPLIVPQVRRGMMLILLSHSDAMAQYSCRAAVTLRYLMQVGLWVDRRLRLQLFLGRCDLWAYGEL